MALELFSQSVVGLDIGSSSIKAVKLKKGKEGYELVGAEIMNLTADSVDELEPDVRFSLYVNTIKKILSQKNIASKKTLRVKLLYKIL